LGFVVWSLPLSHNKIIYSISSFFFPTPNSKHQTINYICLMEVTDALVDKLAHLSRLEFNDADKAAIKNDLQRMISFVEKLDELDLSDTEPLLHMSSNINVLREDEVKGSVSREEALKNAPAHDNKFFKVPKVIKK
jgi:aspartyl-tRNA(Asn)/glutamyl-tRNA(Gln) amidotransferase subunit C